MSAGARLAVAAAGVLDAVRADLWIAPLSRGAGVVLTLHRVREPAEEGAFNPNSALEIAPSTLVSLLDTIAALGMEVVAIDEALRRVRERAGGRFAVITFDDGYRDNIQVAAPILAARGAPWTMFVVTDYLGNAGCAWWLDLEAALAALVEVDVRVGADRLKRLTETVRDKEAAFQILRRLLHAASVGDRRNALERLRQAAGLPGVPIASVFAGWDEVAALAKDGAVTIGSHTAGHGVLSRLSAAEAEAEIRESRSLLEARLGRRVRHLAFPHGDPASAGLREYEIAREAGYEAAWTTRPGHLFSADLRSPWALPRVSINGRFSTPAVIRATLSGAAFPAAAFRRPA